MLLLSHLNGVRSHVYLSRPNIPLFPWAPKGPYLSFVLDLLKIYDL